MDKIKNILAISSVVLLILLTYVTVELIQKSDQARIYKRDYAILHSVEYGMFNSDVWIKKITQIVDKKIEDFALNTNNREEIGAYVETIIDTLILEAKRVVKERNTGKRGFLDSIFGSTKQMITDSLIDFEDLRVRVPEFTSAIMLEIEKPENQARAKKLLREKLKEFMQNKLKTTNNMDLFNNVLEKYNTTDLKKCTTILNTKMQTLSREINGSMLIILTLAVFIILLILLQGVLSSISLFVLSATSIGLLISGVMLPMLDIEAKISKLYFTILDQPIVFENQILFFQSKSISDLVVLLFDSSDSRMVLVGVLLVMFSVIFPTLKLIATTMYFYSKSIIGNNPVTRFFALYSTKWSMADVFVVSIFMAYLGLDGVVSNELRRLDKLSESINIITTNATHLEVGFFLFLGFVLTSFVLSMMVGYKQKK